MIDNYNCQTYLNKLEIFSITVAVALRIQKILTYNGKYFVTEIVRNSIPVAYNYTDGRGRQRGAGNIMTSSYALIKMKKGDEVWIRTYLNYGQLGRCGQWCYFSGFKL